MGDIQDKLDPFMDAEHIPEFYINASTLRRGPFDIEMVFGLGHPIKPAQPLVRIRTSLEHLEMIGEVIKTVLANPPPKAEVKTQIEGGKVVP